MVFKTTGYKEFKGSVLVAHIYAITTNYKIVDEDRSVAYTKYLIANPARSLLCIARARDKFIS